MTQKVFLLVSEISVDGEIEINVYPYSTLEKAKKACLKKAREEFKSLSKEYESDYDKDEVKEEYANIETQNTFYVTFDSEESYINLSIEEKEIK